jgi:probable HAF family extracellular repeat protein
MRRIFRKSAVAISLLLWLALPLGLSAQTKVRYKVVELSLGGPISYCCATDGARVLNDEGVVSSYADTASPDPFASVVCFDPDCMLGHAFRWREGVMTDLGSLADGFNSLASSLNDRGWTIGFSQTGIIDPLSGSPQIRATLWIGPRIVDLGVLPGGSGSVGSTVNNAGQAVGISDNGVPDPFSFFGIGVQIRTFLWEKGELRDIGTLGGPDAAPAGNCSNQQPGVIVGASYTSFTPNESTGIPTQNPFLWHNGKMRDLGNLGGLVNFAQCANNRDEVIGKSSLAEHPGACATGEPGCHAFLWKRGSMKDLGTLGGDNSEAVWINDAGEIAGSADLLGANLHDAVRWKNGKILDLGTVNGDACSRGRAINARGQIVGGSSDCSNFLHAFLWEEGGPMIDLNTVIPPNSGLQLTNALNINDRGEIIAKSVPDGTVPVDDEDLGHLVLLVPCREDRGNCVNESARASGPQTAPVITRERARQPRTMRDAMRRGLGR